MGLDVGVRAGASSQSGADTAPRSPSTRSSPPASLPPPVWEPHHSDAALSSAGWKVSSTTVGRFLHELGYRLQSVRKSREGTSHPDRNAQFEHINSKADGFLQRGQPVVSVDTKKVGAFPGRLQRHRWRDHPLGVRARPLAMLSTDDAQLLRSSGRERPAATRPRPPHTAPL